jgi:protoporphyrinogen oxidase
VSAVDVLDEETGSIRRERCDFLISSVPVRDLVNFLNPADARLAALADGLPYRDFMTAGLLMRRMTVPGSRDPRTPRIKMPPDNWIYIQEPDVRIGRLQIFNNWSPALVADPDTIWLGLEYFCDEGGDLWAMQNGRFIDFAAAELEKIGLIDRQDVLDGTVARVPKAYPAYFGTYGEFDRLRTYLDKFPNLYPIGRNGMHRYNNQDHSMLAADSAVSSILAGGGKEAIWRINADGDYHEEDSDSDSGAAGLQ